MHGLTSRKHMLWYDQLPDTPIGPLFVVASEKGVLSVAFNGEEATCPTQLGCRLRSHILPSPERLESATTQLHEYLSGARTAFDLPLDLSRVTDFQRQALLAVQAVPFGHVTTYGTIAHRLGHPQAARAVGQAMALNPIPVVIPCHRVVLSNGALGGYSGSGGGGADAKLYLLQLEGAPLPADLTS